MQFSFIPDKFLESSAMPPFRQFSRSHPCIESAPAYPQHRTRLLLADRDIDCTLNLLHKALRLLLRHLALACFYPAPKSDESLTKEYAILRIHHL